MFAAALLWSLDPRVGPAAVFYFHFGLAESAVLGAFCAQDLALFVVFFDLMLIPFYFLSGSGAARDRVRATTKLVIYTLVGSFFMLVAAIATGVLASSEHGTPLTFVISLAAGPAAVAHLAGLDLPGASRSRSWSRCRWSRSTAGCPTATRRCRSRRSRCSPAILSKVAAYGFLRIVLPLFPYASRALPDADAGHRAGLDPVGDGGRA